MTAMKLDIFTHIFPKAYYDRMLEVAPNGKDMHKRVREIPSIVDLDARFRIMDRFGDYAQVICLGSPPIEVFGPPPVSTAMARLANDGMAAARAQAPRPFPRLHRFAAHERSARIAEGSQTRGARIGRGRRAGLHAMSSASR